MNAGEPADVTHYVRERHLRMLAGAGLVPVLVPGSIGAQAMAELLDLCSCAYLPGGDYAPLRRGEDPSESAARAAELGMEWDAQKVGADLAVLDAAWENGLPVLAICGGMQAMALRAGGSLRVATEEERAHHAADPGPRDQPIETETLAAATLGRVTQINHRHVQAVQDAGELVVSARCEDGVIEAVEAGAGAHPFWLGLQWHPEQLGDAASYTALAEAAAQRSFSNQ